MSLKILGQAYSTMNQLQEKLDIVSHNIANSDTAGYKNRKATFSSLLYQEINNMTDIRNSEGRITPDGIRVGSGAKLGSVQNNLALGAMKKTARELDTMLLNESHFYAVQVNDGANSNLHFTREGSFYLQAITDNTMALVTKDGHHLMGQNGPIEIPNEFDDIKIDSKGNIILTNGNESNFIDTISVLEARRPRLLEAAGDNLFRLPNLDTFGENEVDLMVEAQGDQLIQSGVIESSNVNLAEEMSEMLIAQRAYQFNARSLTMADQMQGLINQIRT